MQLILRDTIGVVGRTQACREAVAKTPSANLSYAWCRCGCITAHLTHVFHARVDPAETPRVPRSIKFLTITYPKRANVTFLKSAEFQ